MTTVNFQCGHCHNLMAVSEEFLGQQVRCPHCQQVVLAPTPPPADLPGLDFRQPDEHDSIFTPPEPAGDDLFGAAAPPPRIEIPSEPAVPRLTLGGPREAGDPTPSLPPRVLEIEEPTLTYSGPGASGPMTEVGFPGGSPVPGPALGGSPAGEPPAPPAEEGLPPLAVVPRHRVARGNPWVIPLVIAPLAFYSFMATLYILDTKFFHFFSPPPPPHPLEILPDIEGDNKGGQRGARHGSVNFKLPEPDQPLPPQMCVGLGGTLAVGDLEVTPETVERKRIAYVVVGWEKPEPAKEESLVLTLRLRNRSRDVTFKPMDRYFARAWSKKVGDTKPYTLLEMGDRRFYGGPLKWVSFAAARASRTPVEFVEKQTVDQELRPGEEMTTFVCTNPDEPAVKALDAYQGPLLWHVQLRRGLVKWTTRDGVDREDSATTVVGVEFTAADVRKPAD